MMVSTAALIVAIGLGIYCIRQHRRLRALTRQVQGLASQMDEFSQELAGLCAAGVQRDRSTLEQDQRLRECLERVESIQVEDAGGNAYHGAIELIRKGATATEVAGEFGISLAEAELLVRMHRV